MRSWYAHRMVEVAIAVALTVAATAITVFGVVQAMQHSKDGVHAMEVWARPSIGETGNSAAYMRLMNGGKADDALVEVRGDVAKAIELHEHIRDGDIMRMRRVEDGITLAAGQEVALKPGGYHVMLIGLAKPLKEGDSFPLTLVFKSGSEVGVDVKVQMKGPSEADRGSHKGH